MKRSSAVGAWGLAGVGGLALALRLAMAWAIPFASGSPDLNCAPDEAAHLAFVAALARGEAPTWPDRTTSIYAVFPPAPYALHAAALALAGRGGAWGRFRAAIPWAHGYAAARVGGALLGALTAVALAIAASEWTGVPAAGLVTGLIAALYPQAVFVGAYTNSDAFTLCAGAWFVWAMVRWARLGEGAQGLVSVGVAAGSVLVGKMSGFFVLPASGLWVAWALYRRRLKLRTTFVAALACLVTAGPVLGWNTFRNGGDPFGLQHYRWFVAAYWHGTDGRQLPWALRGFLWTLPRSAFGVFRNMDLSMPRAYYRVAAAILVAGLAAGLAGLARAAPPARRAAAWLTALVVTNVALVAYNCWYVDYSPQGRYVLLSALLLFGVAAWGPISACSARGALVEAAAPETGGPASRVPAGGWLWLFGCVAFLTVAAARAQRLVFLNPCLPVH